MCTASHSVLIAGLLLSSVSAWGQTNACDLNSDGKVDAGDVQAAINMSFGLSSCTANISGSNVCNVIVVQRVINAALGATCTTGAGVIHSVSLSWTASASSGVTGYKVYRGTTPGGPYSLLTSAATTSTLDVSALSGQTYYYVVTSVDSTHAESPYSSQVQAVVPIP